MMRRIWILRTMLILSSMGLPFAAGAADEAAALNRIGRG